jgi:hypothetical protein
VYQGSKPYAEYLASISVLPATLMVYLVKSCLIFLFYPFSPEIEQHYSFMSNRSTFHSHVTKEKNNCSLLYMYIQNITFG